MKEVKNIDVKKDKRKRKRDGKRRIHLHFNLVAHSSLYLSYSYRARK